MKGVIELNWKILVGVIAATIIFIVSSLLILGILNTENMGKAAKDICALIVSKLGVFGWGAESLKLCDVFYRG